MPRKMMLWVIAFIVCGAAGCAHQDSKRTVYNAMQQHQCIKDTGNPNCRPESMSYDEYKRQREKLDKDD